jgi:hypothetical protein
MNLCARSTAIAAGLSLFMALSLADLTLTWFLLERGQGCASESNPVASWCLTQFGLPGLAGFKGSIVAIVAALVLCVARRRPPAALRILVFGCATLLAVVLYSGVLACRVEAGAPALGRAQETERDLDRHAIRLHAYLTLRDRLRDDLIAGRCTLAEAVERLAASEYVQDSRWPQVMRDPRHLACALREYLAERLVTHALLCAEAGTPGSKQLAQKLNAQLQACLRRPPPAAPGSIENVHLRPGGPRDAR